MLVCKEYVLFSFIHILISKS
uniref:Uncharacterized protein n=1 Tax=Rhizophora mucronata TaxID=61149 RepID=A0A2P2QIL6_RHIMU